MKVRPFSPAEVLKICAEARPPRDRALFLLLSQTGLRISEALLLTVGSIWRDDGHPRPLITAPCHKRRNGPGTRQVPLPRVCLQDLDCLRRKIPEAHSKSYLFRRPGPGNEPITTRHALRLLDGYCRILDLPPGYGSHSFRKFFANEIYQRSGKDISMAQFALGHRNPTSTIYYLSMDGHALRKAWNEMCLDLFGAPLMDHAAGPHPELLPQPLHKIDPHGDPKKGQPFAVGGVVKGIIQRFMPSQKEPEDIESYCDRMEKSEYGNE